MNTSRTLALLIAFFAAPAVAAAEESKKQEIQSDKIDYFLNAAFARYGFNTARTIGLDRNGVRLKLYKAPKDATQAGIYSHFTLAGEFDFRTDYEVLNLVKPETGYGMSFGIAVHTNGPMGAVFLSRAFHPEWGSCVMVTRELPKGNEKEYESEAFPAAAKKGRLGIRREGKELVLLAAEQKGELQELKRLPFSADPITQLRFYADTGGAEPLLDGRFSSIVIQADSINGAAFPPDTRWRWTTWLLLASLGVVALGATFMIRKRRRDRRDND